MADSVPTNHCVTEVLKELWEQELVELNCNAHTLDGFANEKRKGCQEMDKEMGISTTLGFDFHFRDFNTAVRFCY